ncbi:MAG: hypothetical protein ACREH6_02110, partial [Geminicoccaceae bacterium]
EKRRRADFVIPTGQSRRQALAAIARIVDALDGRTGRAWPERWPAASIGKASLATPDLAAAPRAASNGSRPWECS